MNEPIWKKVCVWFLPTIAALLATGCGGASVEQGVRARAAFDLSCPSDQLNVAQLGSDPMQARYTYGVRGCGKQSAYLCQANAFGDPTCVKNTETTSN